MALDVRLHVKGELPHEVNARFDRAPGYGDLVQPASGGACWWRIEGTSATTGKTRRYALVLASGEGCTITPGRWTIRDPLAE